MPFGLGSVLSGVRSRAIAAAKNSNANGSSLRSEGGQVGGMFGRRRRKQPALSQLRRDQGAQVQGGGGGIGPPPGVPDGPIPTGTNYTVHIDREMLGLTVENVLERTVVRTVLPGGAARVAGARVGSLIVKVGSVDTAHLTHFETIDELRQSQRPLMLVLRQIGDDALIGAREEMGRLIRGGGFGLAAAGGNGGETDNAPPGQPVSNDPDHEGSRAGHLSPAAEAFASSLHRRWYDATRRHCQQQPGGVPHKRDEAISAAGERLVWVLTLLVVGLEREAVRLEQVESPSDGSSVSSRRKHHQSQHTATDCSEAAKSVSKILVDYVKRHLEEIKPPSASDINSTSPISPSGMQHPQRRKRLTPPPPHVQKSLGGMNAFQSSSPFDRALQSIGDVLQRTMTFLVDTKSVPAALLRGEVVALLCDILDIDTDMRLADEEAAGSVAGSSAGSINELGSAGSLLKLIVLNCSIMRSPGCVDPLDTQSRDQSKMSEDEIYGERGPSSHYSHAGNRFLAVVHRLAASRSTSARVTACSLGPVLWAHLDFPHQLQLRGVITRALHDVEVIVRKSTAAVLHEIAELIFDNRAVPWLVLMCERAMTDPEPQLRAAAMTLTWHLAEHLPNAFLGDATKGSRSVSRLPPRTDPMFAEVYLLQCKLLPVATRLAEDRAPSVRLAVAAQCDRLCNALGDHWFIVIIDLLQALLSDTDERVRGEAILCMPRLVDSVVAGTLGASASNTASSMSVLDSLLPLAIKLLQDQSIDVRVCLATACGELLTLLVGLASQEEMLHPSSPTRPNDSVEGSATEETISARLKVCKKHIDEILIPLVQKLLNDTNPEVTSAALRAVTNASRGNVREINNSRRRSRTQSFADDDTTSISSQFSFSTAASFERNEPVFVPVLSEEQVLRLLPTLNDLSRNPQWRVRQSSVEIVPALLGCTHLLDTRSQISQLCIKLMEDHVDAVRNTAAECFCLGGSRLARHGEDDGVQWISAIVIPQLRKCSKSAKYKQRMLCLKMIEVVLANSMCPPAKHKVRTMVVDANGKEAAVPPLVVILDIAANLAEDRVVNVRLSVGRVFAAIAHLPVIEDDELKVIIQVVEKQLQVEASKDNGGGRDVIYFAKQAATLARSRSMDASFHDDTSISIVTTSTN